MQAECAAKTTHIGIVWGDGSADRNLFTVGYEGVIEFSKVLL